MDHHNSTLLPKIQIEQIISLDNEEELHSLCETLEASIIEGYHCKWTKPPPRHLIENHFKGVLLVPEKTLLVARLDGNIVGICEVNTPPKQINSCDISVKIDIFTVAPYALNMGIEQRLLAKMEQIVSQLGFPIINVIIDETQKKLLQFYLQNEYLHWATHPYYQRIDGQIVKGLFLYKSFLNTSSS
ncbi:Phosphoribosylformimino-5-aminoimidazole carboxamide ribonucleotide (ProFAR) isomerase (HisA) (PDB:4U28) [Commensalibacter papalotli (ex Botero et al. 2024)]|uniref:Phosphoribosylformimino-5-aminoimidazole carboxamide ribonucleotide (ProFAR) isomerase (HisA) (PDB:4U28) n=1 Tax=Commensalibacter papalotli (ex Botero et al. 2024) TaxID=2972766 RepID=A0ABN8W752_9PROT|nr:MULTISPECIES: GNAT family N-acetyltransferase [Commensalibacter]CAI3935166.1 Phosphoribosylformimino-5-aminoimidazole carboxamide ribonucleotide (ProFAR) isomerase (HisA) (PDB:4U28) [Commensalibacter papalotli (ex Botero et al. 2024)]CAI3940565.1 Phosphoribosylformimino-5-aminoimidazole carboxamide ribonucleotide (ProFAR) isomerase (HisA) (PDB:4U28) [Commensalibacter papalotli (ex Botero et al. 2024)]